jgi:hypothetical protein
MQWPKLGLRCVAGGARIFRVPGDSLSAPSTRVVNLGVSPERRARGLAMVSVRRRRILLGKNSVKAIADVPFNVDRGGRMPRRPASCYWAVALALLAAFMLAWAPPGPGALLDASLAAWSWGGPGLWLWCRLRASQGGHF